MADPFKLKTKDNMLLQGYSWNPEPGTHTRACLVIVHGLGDHAMRYDGLARYLVSRGIAAYSKDLRGHGQSPGKRGHAAPRTRILEDVDCLCEHAKKENPGVPLFIYGHSMGGNIGLHHRLEGVFRPEGYIITSPWLILYRRLSPVAVALMKVLSAIKPDFCISNGINPKEISSMDQETELYQRDSMIHDRISMRTGYDCWACAREIISRSGEERADLLLMHGAEDHICDVAGSRQFMAGADKACTYREWEGCRHELQSDNRRDEVFAAIADWALERSNGAIDQCQP